jgi:hypothetical protein
MMVTITRRKGTQNLHEEWISYYSGPGEGLSVIESTLLRRDEKLLLVSGVKMFKQ